MFELTKKVTPRAAAIFCVKILFEFVDKFFCPPYLTNFHGSHFCPHVNQPPWIAYVDLKSAFDSIDRQSLWLLLQSLRLPAKIVNLTKAVYTDTCNCVLADGITSD